MKKVTILLLILLISVSFVSCTIVNEYESGIDVAKAALPAVLELTCNFQASVSSATGFVIDERGYVITNAHVITDSAGRYVYEAIEIKGKFYNSKEEYLFDIVAYDIEKDLAVLKFQRNDLTLKVLKTGNSDNLSYGATIFTLGNAEGYGISMTKGIISVPKRMFKDSETGYVNEVIQIDAAVNSGSSGGPLLNIEGLAIGVISFKVKTTDKNIEGIGFAIPSKVFLAFFNSSLGQEVEEETETELETENL